MPGGRRGRGRRGLQPQPRLQPRPQPQPQPQLQPQPQPAAGAERPLPGAAGDPHSENRFCPQCGRGVEPAFRFCPGCGGSLPASPGHRDEQRQREEQRAAPAPPLPPRSPGPVRSPRSPRKARPGPSEPLPAGTVLTDRGGAVWSLGRLLRRGRAGSSYEEETFKRMEKEHSVDEKRELCVTKLEPDVKDGKIYNEQNFFQRAAKAGTVEKWKKQHSVPLLGIPNCIGFGLHADSYRFLVFLDLGRTLQSVMDDGFQPLREKAAFQIVVRLLDCLEYIHENEYVHGDITAENIYLNPADLTQVTLADYCFAFRYCPGGKHMAQREGSRTPHEGAVEFLSLDSHKGAGPSRRSDLESLGYCLLKWLCGFLPWSDELDKVETVMEKKEKYRGDVKCLLRLCFRQRPIPAALQSYLQEVMALGYEEKPDYEALRQLFKKPLEKMKASAYDPVDIKMVP